MEGDGTRNRRQSLSGDDVQVVAEKLTLILRDKLKVLAVVSDVILLTAVDTAVQDTSVQRTAALFRSVHMTTNVVVDGAPIMGKLWDSIWIRVQKSANFLLCGTRPRTRRRLIVDLDSRRPFSSECVGRDHR